MRFDVISLFPEMIAAGMAHGIPARAREKKLWDLGLHNPRDWATDRYKTVDDRPFGGGPGMVMMAAPLAAAIASAKAAQTAALGAHGRVIYLSPAGRKLNHGVVLELLQQPAWILLAGRYEGIDERLLAEHVDEEISLGDFVLSGGEIPALALMDAVIRQLPGAVNDPQSVVEESFFDGLLDHPHYTRPEVWVGAAGEQAVPEVLLSGHHANIVRWRLKQALGRTWLRRPDLLEQRQLSSLEAKLLQEFQTESCLKPS